MGLFLKFEFNKIFAGLYFKFIFTFHNVNSPLYFRNSQRNINETDFEN